jgi:hypothetical protein
VALHFLPHLGQPDRSNLPVVCVQSTTAPCCWVRLGRQAPIGTDEVAHNQPQANKGGGTIYSAMQCKFAYTGVYTHSTCMLGGRKHKHARRLVDKLSLIPFFQFSIVLYVYISVYLHTHLWLSTAENHCCRCHTVALVVARASPRHRHGISAAASPNRHTTPRPSSALGAASKKSDTLAKATSSTHAAVEFDSDSRSLDASLC